ncbi:type VI secretion system baseplate subunit TssE [Caballeronia sp. LP006]|jgi:type VI secretion system protein|uniref:type VI secretion system baseplate subunit TssE n=1 Tax=unclassified Caballeronia TaxID=2646786 RepID=UPI001FD01580|nr:MULTISPECIES: type VI secretion system baseplate subunit TssE [unclassified Caballeronia]MDR5773591.1 type VI secretion system baseplate subunit TssE [Caballeronia sp. LZ002]MDR5805572.1 type VI secretion system baseplate subunit TssE [Caballeronia sp. LZ001]MDR5826811.1 type VI secretion system baseplate subunit TssE [Caballeronia sp. LP006]MDR5849025.1 type VI secretion system baseplate subunit TssE [Caballeronia sp. LZ003]
MRERRLLERISGWEQGAVRTNETSTEVLVRSVMEHLSRILNTRQGSVQLDPQFGVPDFTNIAGGLEGGSTGEIEEEIQRMVSRYEPRVLNPKVHLLSDRSDVMSIRFSLDGTLAVNDREIPLRLSTTVNSDGRVTVL